MKKSIILGCLTLASMAFVGCDDFLDDTRYPYTSQTNSPLFWNNASNCDQMCNRFYNNFTGYGNGAGPGGNFYFSPRNDDNANSSFLDWAYINTPASSSDWNTPYTWLRHATLIMEGVRSSNLSDKEKANYEGIARLNRALQTFELVKKFGNVVWISKPVDINDEGVLYGPRQDRDIVMDSVLQDLNYAVAAISTQSDKLGWSRDMALAVKSDICLWEGTYCLYRTQAENLKGKDEARAKKFLQECVNASEPLMARYQLNDNCVAIYKRMLGQISGDKEWIFGKAYAANILMNPLLGFLNGTTPICGFTKDAFDSFLFRDGLPKGLTTEDTTDKGTWTGDALDISALLAVRDPRLIEYTDPYVFYAGNSGVNLTYSRQTTLSMTSRTGYGVRKYDDLSLPAKQREEAGQSFTCAPIYYLSEIICNYAEAQAELGQTQKALDAIHMLNDRVGLPQVPLFHDPANTYGLSDIVWEARRTRRCELIMDRDYRYWDLVRWHMLDKLDSNNHPEIKQGANYTPSPITPAFVCGDYIDGYFGSNRSYDKKYYFYPIPTAQLTLNPELGQNPGW